MALPKFYSVDAYFEYFPDLFDLLAQLRYHILNLDPRIKESVKFNCPFYDYYGMFLFLGVQKHKVVLGFVNGVELGNSAGAFKISKLKQVRHLEYQNIQDLNVETLIDYLQEAMLINELRYKMKSVLRVKKSKTRS